LLTLLDPQDGQFHAFVREFGLQGRIRFDASCVHVITGPAGPLHDIRSPAENAMAADSITAFVRRLCLDAESAVHVSIAGGRKSMGYYLGYALSLFGREQDRLSHVLVSEPFETMRDFYYPPRTPRVLVTAQGNPVTTADARIDLADIPFVRLRDGLPSDLLGGDATFSETVAAATREIAPPALRFVTKECAVEAAGQSLRLPPLLWAWYRMHARVRAESRGATEGLRWVDVNPERLLREYRAAVGPMSHDYLQLQEQLARDQGVTERFFREKNAKLNRVLKSELALLATPYLLQSIGNRPRTSTGVSVAASRIDL
jgi:CRISPR-associated protein (TIGR02584 family)